MRRLFNAYLRLLRDYTLPTQMATSGTIIPLGDTVAQHFIEGKEFKDHDWKRTGRFVFYGFACWAPLQYTWHLNLNRVKFQRLWQTGVARLAIDMSVFAPFGMCFFFSCMGKLEGRSWEDIKTRIQHNFWYIYSRGLFVFGPVQVLNLTVTPVWARPPVLNLVSLGWSCFLATMNTRETNRQQQLAKEKRILATIGEQPI